MFSAFAPVCLLVVVALCAPAPACRLLRFVERPFILLAQRARFAILFCGLITLASNAALSLLGQFPQPRVHDEFSYLLQSDTFAHGRLTNPPHALWVHFDSMHIIQQPTYASKYPPAQGVLLAVGQVVCGQPIVGAWLSGALASAAICWMLFVFLPPRWAALGGVLAAAHPLMFAWCQCYWGGAVAACGGALVLGAAGRIRATPRPGAGLLLGLGMAILANSRPFEGLLLTALVLIPLLVQLLGSHGPALRITIQRVVGPASLSLLPVFIWMGYYNWRVTGNILLMPFLVYAANHDVAPKFLWQSAKPEPVYLHKEIHDLHVGWELPSYERQQTPAGFASGSAEKLEMLIQRYFPFVIFQIPFLATPWSLALTKTRRALLQAGLFVSALLFSEIWLLPHYAAPATGLFILLAIDGLRFLCLWSWRGRAVGRLLVRLSLILSAVLLLQYCLQVGHTETNGWNIERARTLELLNEQPGKHLVLVHYGPKHITHEEWVYNQADIDNSKVVWARDMGAEKNQELVVYFRERRLWLLEADENEIRMVPYSTGP